MLTKAHVKSMVPVHHACGCLMGIMLMAFFPCSGFCADDFAPKKRSVVLLFEAPKDSYSYRKTYHEKTLSIMLYGFKDQPISNPILKDRKALSAFFKQHLDRIKDDYFSKDPNRTRFVTGETAFNSMQINRGPALEAAKMAGFTMPWNKHITFGGGYTWGERNPAMLRLTKAEGFFTGLSYDTGSTGFQLSYLSSGQRVVGFKVGGTDIRYDSLMLGTSFRVNRRIGLTATLQYRKDKDPLTTGDQQMVFTVGTKWKF